MTCPNVVPMLAFDHVFVAGWLLAKALSRLFLYRTHLAVCCHDISDLLRIPIVRVFNCADTTIHKGYPQKRKNASPD